MLFRLRPQTSAGILSGEERVPRAPRGIVLAATMGRSPLLASLHGIFNLGLVLIFHRSSSVIVSNITLVTESNRTDYALQGEAASLLCNYITGQDETVSAVRWEWKRSGSEEATEVYVWRPGRRPVAKEVFFGRTDVSNALPGVVVIRQADMEMEGRYKCLVQTNQRTAHTEFNFIIIVDACKENVWHTTLDMDTCSETIQMHCVGLFPKPSASCGVFNELTQNSLTSVPFDRIVTLRNGTYEVTLKTLYSIRDWSSYTDISFHCYFVIDGTSWRRGIRHRLFGAFGCPPKPPLPGPGIYNMSEEKSCWNMPREGATVHYTCNSGKRLRGPETLVCRNGTWAPEFVVWDGPSKPFCNTADSLHSTHLLAIILFSVISTFSEP